LERGCWREGDRHKRPGKVEKPESLKSPHSGWSELGHVCDLVLVCGAGVGAVPARRRKLLSLPWGWEKWGSLWWGTEEEAVELHLWHPEPSTQTNGEIKKQTSVVATNKAFNKGRFRDGRGGEVKLAGNP
jgi:hypothetical protein